MDTLSTTSLPIHLGQSFEDLPIDDGVDTRSLSPGDLVSIRTLNSVYKMRLDEPLRGRGVATGDGDFINEESTASLIGATLTGQIGRAHGRNPVPTPSPIPASARKKKRQHSAITTHISSAG